MKKMLEMDAGSNFLWNVQFVDKDAFIYCSICEFKLLVFSYLASYS
jgi:hypothetical protein